MKLTIMVIIASAVTMSFSGLAQQDNLSQSLVNCSEESNDTQRLQCYDQLAKKITFSSEAAAKKQANKPMSEPTQQLAEKSVAPITRQANARQANASTAEVNDKKPTTIVEPTKQQTVTILPASQPEKTAKIPAEAMKEIEKREVDNFGIKAPKDKLAQLQLTVDNVKKNSRGYRIFTFSNGQVWRQLETKYIRLKPGDKVVIDSAALGSFLLKKTEGGQAIRVKRVN